MTPGSRLKSLLVARGISQKELAADLGVNETSISQIVRGHRQNWDLIRKIAHQLNVSIDYFDGDAADELHEEAAAYKRKPLISIDLSHFEEKMQRMDDEMTRLEKEVAFLRELILKQTGASADNKEPVTQ